MRTPAAVELLKGHQSYYSLVMAVAKRAREISEDAEENGEILIQKTVQLAIDDFIGGRYSLKESEELEEMHDGNLE